MRNLPFINKVLANCWHQTLWNEMKPFNWKSNSESGKVMLTLKLGESVFWFTTFNKYVHILHLSCEGLLLCTLVRANVETHCCVFSESRAGSILKCASKTLPFHLIHKSCPPDPCRRDQVLITLELTKGYTGATRCRRHLHISRRVLLQLEPRIHLQSQILISTQ